MYLYVCIFKCIMHLVKASYNFAADNRSQFNFNHCQKILNKIAKRKIKVIA